MYFVTLDSLIHISFNTYCPLSFTLMLQPPSTSFARLTSVSRYIRNSDKEGEALSRLSKGRSRWREETASAVFAPDKSTSRSAFKNVVICVCIPRARTCRPRMCVPRLYRSGLSSIAMKVSEGTSDLTIRRGVWTSCY